MINLSSRLPGTATWAFDESTFVWNIWYFKHALLDLHISPLHSDLIWFPLGTDLVLYTYNFFNALVALPLQVALNLPLASNLTLLLATVLSGFGAYLLALDVLRAAFCKTPNPASGAGAHRPFPGIACRLGAFLAGIIYAFASNRAVYAALGHYNMVTTQWVPFYTLYLLRTLQRPGRKNALLAGLFFALAALADMIYASLLGLLSVVVLLALWRQLRDRKQALLRLAGATAVALLVWSPALVPIARSFATDDYVISGWGETVKLSADVAGLFTPTDLNPLFTSPTPVTDTPGPYDSGAPTRWQAELRATVEGKGRFSDINTVFLGYATVALALLGAWRARGHGRVWTWSTLIFGVLALGPLLQINGRYRFGFDNLVPEGVTFPLPFTILHYVPFFNANRAPNRNSQVLMLALAVLAAYGAAWLLAWLRNPRRAPAPTPSLAYWRWC